MSPFSSPSPSGKVSVLFSCLSGLLKDKKGQRHFVFLKPSWFTFKDTGLLFKRQVYFLKDRFTFQKDRFTF